MKIKYASLTISSPENPPKNFSLTLKRTLQTDKAIGLENAIVSDKGNCIHSVSFIIENSRKTIEKAEEFCLDFLREVSNASPASLKIFFGENETENFYEIENAVLSKCKASIDGHLISHALEFTAGALEG